jgi:hypothetical protein
VIAGFVQIVFSVVGEHHIPRDVDLATVTVKRTLCFAARF